jgi:uncharacterized membrane protein
MERLIVLAVLALLAGPVLAILALVAVRRVEGQLGQSSLAQLTARLYALEQKIASMERFVAEPKAASPPPGPRAPEPVVQSGLGTTAPGVETPHSSVPLPPPVPVSVSAADLALAPEPAGPAGPRLQPLNRAQTAPPEDLESRIGGKWFSRIGIVALLISVSYFLKLAFDNDWIGHSGRIAIGVLAGALMLPWSQWLLGRGYTYFSEGIAGLGEATLFLSVWAGCQYYTLYRRDVGFAAMIAITAVMAAVAIGRNSHRIAVLSLLGGLLTPILASSGKNEQVVLFTYLLLLGAGALTIAWKKDWNSLAPIAFFGTQIYFWGWYSQFFRANSPVERTVAFATAFYLLYSAVPILRAMHGEALGELNVAMLFFNSFAYSGALFILLWPDDKWPLTLLFVSLAAANVAIARLIPSPGGGQAPTARLLYAGLALTFLTLAIPVRLEGKWITLSFAVEGAILVWTGFRAASNFLRQAGYLLLAISGLRLLLLPPEGGPFLFNARFGAYVVMVACFGIALWAAKSHPAQDLGGQERVEIGIFAVAINVFALVALSMEFWDYFGKASTTIDSSLAQHLALSILWTLFASGLLIFGIQNKSPLLRWQGLVLFGLVVGKVFLYDLSFLERVYRILSFFVLGAVLMAVSFLYERKLRRERETS